MGGFLKKPFVVMPVLYRKYRPQKFDETFGQNHIKITLQNEIQLGKISHAYLFCGPRAVGKTTLARVFSKAINCLNRKENKYEPCDKCEVCNEIREGKSLDVLEIDAASHTGVDNVRDNIIASARVAPSKNKYKVFIIDEVHMLSISAFNALLKIMEEPPANVVFILCTTEVHKVPATIISRCQRFDFKRISIDDIVKRLSFIAKEENIKIDNQVLESIARHSEGYMRDAISLLGQIISIGGKNITQEEADLVIPRSNVKEIVNLIDALSKKDASTSIQLINKLVDDSIDLKNFVNNLIEVLRKMMIAKINPNLTSGLALDLGESLELKINEISSQLDVNQLIFFIESFLEARNKLKESFIIQLPLEIAIAEICLGSVKSAGSGSDFIKQSPVSSFKKSNTTPITSKTKPTKNLNIDISTIKEKWPEVLTKIKKHNHSLSFILRVCEPKKLNDGQVYIAFKYKFHKDRVDSPEIKKIIEDVLAEVFDTNIAISTIVDESIKVNENNLKPDINSTIETSNFVEKQEKEKGKGKGKDNNTIDNLLKNFGGKIIN